MLVVLLAVLLVVLLVLVLVLLLLPLLMLMCMFCDHLISVVSPRCGLCKTSDGRFLNL